MKKMQFLFFRRLAVSTKSASAHTRNAQFRKYYARVFDINFSKSIFHFDIFQFALICNHILMYLLCCAGRWWRRRCTNVFHGQSRRLCMGPWRLRHCDHTNAQSDGEFGTATACQGENPGHPTRRNRWRTSQSKATMFRVLGRFSKNGNCSKVTVYGKCCNDISLWALTKSKLTRLLCLWFAAYLSRKLHCTMVGIAWHLPSLPKNCR